EFASFHEILQGHPPVTEPWIRRTPLDGRRRPRPSIEIERVREVPAVIEHPQQRSHGRQYAKNDRAPAPRVSESHGKIEQREERCEVVRLTHRNRAEIERVRMQQKNSRGGP